MYLSIEELDEEIKNNSVYALTDIDEELLYELSSESLGILFRNTKARYHTFNVCDMSKMINLTEEILLKNKGIFIDNGRRSNIGYFSSLHPNISVRFMIKQLHMGFNIGVISMAATQKEILLHKYFDWHGKSLSLNKNVDYEFYKNNPDLPWDRRTILKERSSWFKKDAPSDTIIDM